MVPGLSCEHAAGRGQAAVPDVMRGEEVQIFGAMRLSGLRDGTFVLPGTHSKWASVQDGRITGFKTFMTGEVFALLSQHSILSKTIAAEAPFDEAAFAQGLAQAQGDGGLLNHAFSARTLSLFGRMDAAALASYLSGLVIGEELRANAATAGGEVVLIGSANLTRRYGQAISLQGGTSRALGSEATWAGLTALADVISKE
jgi:2-dehydro-3-deoxygalactonokinase